jgi:DNA replication protein DnaC
LNQDLCPKCNGTGWIIKVRKGQEVASRCPCRVENLALKKGLRANIPQRFLGAGLEWGYTPDPGNPSQKKAKNVIGKFVRDYPAVEEGLLLQGSIGLGKTSLLCSIGFELIKNKNIDIYYIDWNDLVREMRTGEDHASRDFQAINRLISRLIGVELLLFDELGASKVSPWVHDTIYYMINKRYNQRKITVFATNFYDDPSDGKESLEERIGDRIRSRLYEMTRVIEINGEDFRRKNLRGD